MSNADLEFLKSRLQGRMGLYNLSADKEAGADGAIEMGHTADGHNGAAKGLDEDKDKLPVSVSPQSRFKSDDVPFWEAGDDEHTSAQPSLTSHHEKDDETEIHHVIGVSVPSSLDSIGNDNASAPLTFSTYDTLAPFLSARAPQTPKSGDNMTLFARSEHSAPPPKAEIEAEVNNKLIGDIKSLAQHNKTDDYLRSFADQSAMNDVSDEPFMRGAVFAKIVKSDHDIVGLVAYSLYKLNKYDWAMAFRKSKNREPNENEIESFAIGESMLRRLTVYRQLAEQLLLDEKAYADLSGVMKQGQHKVPLKTSITSALPTVIYLLLALGSVVAGFIAFRYIGTLVGR